MAELTTVAKVQAHIGQIASADTTFITTLLGQAEQIIRDLCSRPSGWLNTSSHTETFPGAGWERIVLKYKPVTAITSVKIYSASATSTTVSSSEYRIDDGQSVLLLSPAGGLAAWAAGTDLSCPAPAGTDDLGISYPYTEVVYTGGYASNAIPTDLEYAANEITATLYRRLRGTASSKQFDIDTDQMEDYFKRLLLSHRRDVGVG